MGPLGMKPPRLRAALIAVLAAMATMAVASPGVASAAPSLSVSCLPAPVEVGKTADCLALVNTGFADTPASGKVTFTNSDPGFLSPAVGSCHVQPASPGSSSGSCSLTIRGQAPGDENVLASYEAPTAAVVTHSSIVQVVDGSAKLFCDEEPVVGDTTECEVRILGKPGSPAPTGTVAFTAVAKNGALAGQVENCTLLPLAEDPAPAVCRINYTPRVTGKTVLLAEYGGDGVHPAQNGSRTVMVAAQHETRTTVQCTKELVGFSRGTCQAIVHNVSGTGLAPTGRVRFQLPFPETTIFPFSDTCTLRAPELQSTLSLCSVAFEPQSEGPDFIEAAYSGAPLFESSSSEPTSFFVEELGRTTKTTVSCQTAVLGAVAECSVNVRDTQSQPRNPKGLVFLDAGGNTELSPEVCELKPQILPGQSSCSFEYQPFRLGDLTIRAEYQGDIASHRVSKGETTVVVKGVLGAH